MLCRAASFFLYFSFIPSTIRSVIPSVRVLYVPVTINTLVNHKKNALTAQLSPAIYSSAAQRSALQRRAVPCGAVPCPAVLCRTALCFLSSIHKYQVSCDTRCRPVCMYVAFALFSLSSFDCPLVPPFFVFENYTRTGDQNVTSPTNTHNTAQGNQLCVSSSWHYQNPTCTK